MTADHDHEWYFARLVVTESGTVRFKRCKHCGTEEPVSPEQNAG